MFVFTMNAFIDDFYLCDYIYSNYYDQPEIYDITVSNIPSVNLIDYNNSLCDVCTEYVVYIPKEDYYYDNYDVIIYT